MKRITVIIIILIILLIPGWRYCRGVYRCVFPNEVHGDLIINGQLYFDYPHSILQFADSSCTPAMDEDVWIQITNGGNTLYTTYETDIYTVARDKIFPNLSGDIQGNVGITIDGSDKDDYEIALMHNATIIRKRRFQIPKDGGLGDKAFSFYITGVANGDSIYVNIRNIDNDNDPDFIDGYLDVFFMPEN